MQYAMNYMGKFQLCKHSQITMEQGSSFKTAKIDVLCDVSLLSQSKTLIPLYHTLISCSQIISQELTLKL